MPKPGRPINQTPDYGFNNGPGMHVPGEPVFMPTKPSLIDQNPVEPHVGAQDQQNLNPYPRTRHPRPGIRPENQRNDREDYGGNGVVILDDNNQPVEKPGRQNPRLQPYPRAINSGADRQQAPASDAPAERVGRQPRQERSSQRMEPPRERF